MKTIVIEEYGPTTALKLRSREARAPAEDEVAVEIMAASYNPVDTALREGSLDPVSARSFPQGQGQDWSGVVKRVGEQVQNWKVGDELVGCRSVLHSRHDEGAWADRLVTETRYVAAKPSSASWEESAALPLVGMTALQALRDDGELKAGDSVLVNGASGGVGHLAVQLARILGAARVVGTASPKHLDFVRSLGVDEAIDYNRFDPSAYAGAFDIFFDAAAKSTFQQVHACLSDRGMYLRTRPTAQVMAEAAATKVAGLVGYDKRAKVVMLSPRSEDLAWLSRLVDQGELKVVVAESYPFEQYLRFVKEAEKSEKAGKYILRVGPGPR